MKTLFYLLFFIPAFIFSQQEESKESKLFRYKAQQERKKSLTDTIFKKEYIKNELSYYIKGENLGEYKKLTYQAIIRSCAELTKLEENDSLVKIYFDTINIIQSKMEKNGMLDDVNYLTRINWFLKGSNPDREKIDSLFVNEFSKNTPMSNNEYLIYFLNLNYLYKEKNRENDRIRIYNNYMSFMVNDTISETELNFYKNIFKEVYTKEMVIKYEDLFWKNYKSNRKRLDFMMGFLQESDNNTTTFYKKTLDTLISIEPTTVNYFKLANYHLKNGETTQYDNVIKQIMTKFPQFKDENDYNNCVELFNSGKYMSAYNLALQINGKYKGEALKIAGACVSALASQSGLTTFERKCNYYYAIQLLEKAKLNNTPTSNLITQYRAYLPTTEEKFDIGNPKTIKLTTWNVTVSID
jgi:hypothetical protein